MNQIEIEVQQEKLERISYLKRQPAFSSLDQDTIMKLSSLLKLQNYYKNHVVYKIGDFVENIYFVKRGEFSINKLIELRNDSSEDKFELLHKYKNTNLHWIVISTIQEGQMFGNEDEYRNSTRQYQVKCSSFQGSIFSLNLRAFDNILANNGSKITVNSILWQVNQHFKNQIYRNREQSFIDLQLSQRQVQNSLSPVMGASSSLYNPQNTNQEPFSRIWKMNASLPQKQEAHSSMIFDFPQHSSRAGSVRKNSQARSNGFNEIKELTFKIESKENVLQRKKGNFFQFDGVQLLGQQVNLIKAHMQFLRNPKKEQIINQIKLKPGDNLPFMEVEPDQMSKVKIIKRLGIRQKLPPNRGRTYLDYSQIIINDLSNRLNESKNEYKQKNNSQIFKQI